MVGCILHRMVFWELVKVFVLCLVAITGILLMAGIVAEATQQGLNPGQILAIIPLLIPSTLPYTIPATTLFATCVVCGRLSADNEILAIRASGINLMTVVGPALLVGLLASAATMGLYYRVIPYTHHLMRSLFINDVEELLYAMLKKHGQITYAHFDYAIYVKGVQGRRMLSPTFKHRNERGEVDVVAVAQEAELRVDMNRKLILVRMFRSSAWSPPDGHAFFDDKTFEVPLPEHIDTQFRRARDMTWEEIYQTLDDLAGEERGVEALLEQARTCPREKAPADLDKHVFNLERKLRSIRSQVYALLAELQMRPALSLGCVFFVLVGCPVGIWFGRSDYLSSFITCFLPIVFAYYPLILCGTGMAKSGRFNPVLTIWAADIVTGAVGVVLLGRLLRR